VEKVDVEDTGPEGTEEVEEKILDWLLMAFPILILDCETLLFII